MSKKRALVFGNNNYARGVQLSCCIQNARDIGAKLKTIGFEVDLDCDPSYARMTQAIIDFQEKIEHNDLVVFFFSGHGVGWKGQAYLIATDDKCIMEKPAMCEHHAVSVQKTLESMMA